MVAQPPPSTRSLYEKDFSLWLSLTAKQLRERKFDEVDLDNLIEEIESVGRSERNSIRSFLKVLLEHLLKVAYLEFHREYNLNGWLKEIFNFRDEIQERLNNSPSLNSYLLEIFDSTYTKAVKSIEIEYKYKAPSQCPFTLEQVLDFDWLPIDVDERT